MIQFIGRFGWAWYAPEGRWASINVPQGEYMLVRRIPTEAGLAFVEMRDSAGRLYLVDSRNVQ